MAKLPAPVRVAHRAYEQATAKRATAARHEIDALERDLRVLANRAASLLGHIPLRQGHRVECSRCSASGTATNLLSGDVHFAKCEGA
jgi:hypothetical protein